MSATLTITPSPYGLDVRHLILDCEHGETSVHIVGRAPEAHEVAAVRLALARHYEAEGCRCTLALRRGYGLVQRER